MFTSTTYKGTKNGIYGIYCGFKPKGLKVEEEIMVYHADEGKIFIKDKEEFTDVVLQEGESIKDYQEIEKAEEEPLAPQA